MQLIVTDCRYANEAGLRDTHAQHTCAHVGKVGWDVHTGCNVCTPQPTEFACVYVSTMLAYMSGHVCLCPRMCAHVYVCFCVGASAG